MCNDKQRNKQTARETQMLWTIIWAGPLLAWLLVCLFVLFIFWLFEREVGSIPTGENQKKSRGSKND